MHLEGVIRSLVCGIAVAISSVQPSAAQDQERVWAAVGNWSIRIGLQPFAQAKECFLLTKTHDGSFLRLGFAGRGLYVSIGNPAWQSLHIGGTYDLSMRFTGQSAWPVSGQVLAQPGIGKVLLVRFDEEPAFRLLRQFTTQPKLTFFYRDKLVVAVPLTESQPAAKALFDCESTFAPPIR